MNKAFDKILERLQNIGWVYADYYPDGTNISRVSKKSVSYDEVIKIVQEVAEEYNGGWIPCSERLPEEKDGIVLICCEDGNVMTGEHSEFNDTWYKGNMYAVCGSNVIAWQPLPEPYKQKGEW